MGSIASHVIGFTSNDNRGLGGIELLFDKDLRGSAGQSIFLADSSRRSIRLKEYNGTLSDGVGIILTIERLKQRGYTLFEGFYSKVSVVCLNAVYESRTYSVRGALVPVTMGSAAYSIVRSWLFVSLFFN